VPRKRRERGRKPLFDTLVITSACACESQFGRLPRNRESDGTECRPRINSECSMLPWVEGAQEMTHRESNVITAHSAKLAA
jgi:hypothetical protein